MENKRTILLTGSSGFLGSRILNKIRKKHTVYLLNHKNKISKSIILSTHLIRFSAMDISLSDKVTGRNVFFSPSIGTLNTKSSLLK